MDAKKPPKIGTVANWKFARARKGFPPSLNRLLFSYLAHYSQIRSDIDFYFDENKITLPIEGEADDVALLRIAAERGVGFSVCSARPSGTREASVKWGA